MWQIQPILKSCQTSKYYLSDCSFSNAKFRTEEYSIAFMLDHHNMCDGRVLIHVREDMSCEQKTKHNRPDDIEILFCLNLVFPILNL